MSLGILFPGQGSQSIGMLKDLKSSFKVVSEIFEEASDYLSCDLWKITKNGPAIDHESSKIAPKWVVRVRLDVQVDRSGSRGVG